MISFADDIDSKLQTIQIPDINGVVRCSECINYDGWSYVDHDFTDPDSFQKEVRYRCTCGNDTVIYLDEDNKAKVYE